MNSYEHKKTADRKFPLCSPRNFRSAQTPPASDFDSYARKVLRACARIPSLPRRYAYYNSCIRGLNNPKQQISAANRLEELWGMLDEDERRDPETKQALDRLGRQA